MNFVIQRKLMVETQLISRGIKDIKVIEAMYKVPRHLFVNKADIEKAYDDIALPIGYGQTISQPYMVAIMTELLQLQGDEKVLEIGTGSGYQAAILAELAKEVYSVERIYSLAKEAEERLNELGYTNIWIFVRDGTLGLSEYAPFDRIIITAAAPEIPETLKKQLKEGGIIVAPVGSRYSQQLLKIKKEGEKFNQSYHTLCLFVPLIGKYGWQR